MFRIISRGIASLSGEGRASGVFGSPKALHRLPRRYKLFEKAFQKALKLPGEHTVMDDERKPCAVVKDGQVIAIHVDHDPTSDVAIIARMLRGK